MANTATADPQAEWDLEDTVEFRQHLHVLHAELKRCEQEEVEAKEAFLKKKKAREDARAKLDLAIEEDCRGLPLWEHAQGGKNGSARTPQKTKRQERAAEADAPKVYPMPDHLKPEDLDRAYFVSQLYAGKEIKKPIPVKPFSTEGSEWVVHGIANYEGGDRHWQALKLVSVAEFKERWPQIDVFVAGNHQRSGVFAGDAYAGLLVSVRGKKCVVAPASEGIRFVLKAQEK